MERATVESIGIKALSRAEIADFLKNELGAPAFRSKQIIQWLYGKGVATYDEMTNISKDMRSQLAQKLPLLPVTVTKRQSSKDGTRKYLVRMGDGTLVETVGMPGKNKLCVCVSTQAGCPMRCTFCATGRNGYTRNLGPGEIVDQVRVVANDFGQPFLNYDAVLEAMRILNSKDGFDIGARHITVSTAGILPQIRRFASEPEQFTLAISLHSAVQDTRDELMPGVRQYDLERLRDSVASYAETTGRRPTYEYAMMAGINDTDAQLKALVAFCRRTLCHVNLITLNEVAGSPFQPSEKERVALFAKTLSAAGVETTIRESRGTDIDAACGQLKQKA